MLPHAAARELRRLGHDAVSVINVGSLVAGQSRSLSGSTLAVAHLRADEEARTANAACRPGSRSAGATELSHAAAPRPSAAAYSASLLGLLAGGGHDANGVADPIIRALATHAQDVTVIAA